MSEFTQSLAVVVGINNYQNGIPHLKTAVNDAKKIADILKQEHNYNLVWELVDEQATLKELQQLLETLKHKVQSGDRLLFYFAGHGIALNGDDGPGGYLIPQDATRGETGTYLPMTKLHDDLSKLPCRHFLGIFDCCFAGAFRWSSTRSIGDDVPEVLHQERYDRFIADPAWQVLTSAASDQKALDAFNIHTERGQPGDDHSPFAAALIDALSGKADAYPPADSGRPAGDGVITATELYLYLRDRVEFATGSANHCQTPGIWPLKKHDKGEYIFLAPGHSLNLPPAPKLNTSNNPYRGLEAYEEEHSQLFFGRAELAEKLQRFVEDHSLTLVLGTSGSGKSSLVKAGLIPQLRQKTTEQEVTQQWLILPPVRPGKAPLQSLNNALREFQLLEIADNNPQLTLANSIEDWAKKHTNTKLLLFIDQSEEIISLCQNEDERRKFFLQILEAIIVHWDKLRIVLSLRSDFEPQVRNAVLEVASTETASTAIPLESTELNDHWQKGRFIVPAMTRSELRDVIEKPAEARVMYFEPHELVEQLIDEVAGMPGALPLLSFALSELYLNYLKRQEKAQNEGKIIDRALTQDDYQAVEGVVQSLAKRADKEYEELVNKDPAYGHIIRNVMLRMVTLGGGELARRQVLLSELNYPQKENDLVETVIGHFTDKRLLVTGEDANGDQYVEPAHDVLVRGWQKLLEWKQQEEEKILQQRRLTPAANEWKTIKDKEQSKRILDKAEFVVNWLDQRLFTIESLVSKIPAQLVQLLRHSQNQSEQKRVKPAQFLWDDNPYLNVLDKELNSDDNWFNQVESDFVQESVEQRRRDTSWQRRSAIVIILGLSGLSIAALIGQRNAQIGQIEASRQASEASLQLGQDLEALTASLRAAKSLEAWPWYLSLFKPDSNLQPQVSLTLQKVIYGIHERDRINQDKGQLISGLDANGNSLENLEQYGFDCSWNNLVCLWDKSGEQMAKFLGSHRSLDQAIFSPDRSKLIIVSSKDGGGFIEDNTSTVHLWDLNSNELIADFKGHQSEVRSVSFSPDGNRIAIAGDNGISLWDVNGNQIPEFEGGQGRVTYVAFSPDSTQLASVSDSTSSEGYNNVRFWDLRGQQVGQLNGDLLVDRVIFSSDGALFATTGSDGTEEYGTARLWNRLGEEVGQVNGAFGNVVFSADGRLLAGSGEDNVSRVWDLSGDQLFEFKVHQGWTSSEFFSPDGKRLVTTGRDSTIRLWELTSQRSTIIFAESRSIFMMIFSPDGSLVATRGTSYEYDPNDPNPNQYPEIGRDNAVSLWDLQGNKLGEIPTNRGNQGVRNIAISPDNQLLAIVEGNGVARLWNWRNKQQLEEFKEPEGSSLIGVSFSGDRSVLITKEEDGTIRLWNWKGEQVAEFKDPQDQVSEVILSPDGSKIVTVGNEGLRLWNLEGEQISQINITLEGEFDFNRVVLSRNNRLVAIHEELGGEYGFTVWNWDGKLVAQFQEGYAMDFSPDGSLLTTSQHLNDVIHLWHLESGQQIAEYPTPADFAAHFSPDGRWLVTGGNDVPQLWRVESLDDLMRRGCDWVRNFLQNNPNVSERDRHLCDGIEPTIVP